MTLDRTQRTFIALYWDIGRDISERQGESWTKHIAIENKTYEKYLLGQTNFGETLSDTIKKQAVLAVKDEYTEAFGLFPHSCRCLFLPEGVCQAGLRLTVIFLCDMLGH